jgi:hypothetical protein
MALPPAHQQLHKQQQQRLYMGVSAFCHKAQVLLQVAAAAVCHHVWVCAGS